MTADENLVPDDEPKSTIPDAVIKIEVEKPADGAQATKPAVEIQDAAQEGVDALAKNLEAEKKRREAAESKLSNESSKRVEAEQRATHAESRISGELQKNIDANRAAATTAIEANKAKRDQAKKDFSALTAEGKFDEAFEATQVAAQASAEIKGAEGYLANLEIQVAKLQEEPVRQTQVDDGGKVDPVTGIKFTPTTYDWVEKHRDKWVDQDFRLECDAASRKAKKKGLKEDTPEYFEFVEQRLQREGYLDMPEQDDDGQEEPKPKPTQKKMSASSMGAAPTRAVPGTTSVPSKGVKLTGMEREMARSLVESLPEVYGRDANPDQIYAKNKMAIQQEDGE